VKRKKIFVNALTFSRLPLIFAWMAMAVAVELRQPDFWFGFWAVMMMGASGFSDLFDGMLARKWDVVSPLGKMADPLMDKVFFTVTFPTILWVTAHRGDTVHAVMMLAFTVLYMVRDLWITFLRSVGTMYGADVAAMRLGKIRTALSFVCAGWVYMYLLWGNFAQAAWRSAWLASCYVFEALLMLLTMLSVLTYTRAYAPYLKKALERK
jgi:CDP-diacylglycerol--glycerol-3-phosphate 3-phosphatidyltransferase